MNKKILFIIGSFRENSFHATIAENVKQLIGNRAEVKVLNYKNIPLYNQDLESNGGVLEVNDLRKYVQEFDGIWIFSPEYNGQIPGILKNVLDWLSRSLDPNNSRGESAVHQKPVTITAGAGAPKAPNVRRNLAELLPFMRMNLIYGEGVGLTFTGDTWSTGMFKPSIEELTELNKQVDEFLTAL